MLLLTLAVAAIALQATLATGSPQKLRPKTLQNYKATTAQLKRKLKMVKETQPIIKDLEHYNMFKPFVEKFSEAIFYANKFYFENRVRVTETYRTLERQDELYGREKKATSAKSGQSMHNFGLAIDIWILTPDGKYSNDIREYEKLANVFTLFGLKHLRANWDLVHYQHPTALDVIELYETCQSEGRAHEDCIVFIHQELRKELAVFNSAKNSGLFS